VYHIDRIKESILHMEKIIEYFKSQGRYGRMKDLKKTSVQTSNIACLLKEGTIVKVKPGLYSLANFIDVVLPAITINATGYTISVVIMDVCRAIPEGVICLASALEFYGLTTFNLFFSIIGIFAKCYSIPMPYRFVNSANSL
jgi:predicted transcriptional regulator of viral defense system